MKLQSKFEYKKRNGKKKRNWLLHECSTAEFCELISKGAHLKTDKRTSAGKLISVNLKKEF